MTLMCECDFDPDGWYYYTPEDYQAYPQQRRKRCCSCKDLISPGDLALRFDRARGPKCDIEEDIYGDEVPLAAWWMCEECADMYWSLDELGFCVLIGGESMRELCREYAEQWQWAA
jgi:hypothetical protein